MAASRAPLHCGSNPSTAAGWVVRVGRPSTPVRAPGGREMRTSRVQVVLIGALLVAVAIRFAEPLQDGDLFWHMAYARQMLAHRTLIPDHAAFSWTPAQTDVRYCAWLSELFLYGLWEHVGVGSLFALRYLIVLAIAGLAYAHARRLGL